MLTSTQLCIDVQFVFPVIYCKIKMAATFFVPLFLFLQTCHFVGISVFSKLHFFSISAQRIALLDFVSV